MPIRFSFLLLSRVNSYRSKIACSNSYAGLDSTFSDTKTQLLTVPPYAVAGAFTILIGYISDRTNQRGLCNILCAVIGCVGFSILLGSTNAALSYFATVWDFLIH